MNARLIQRAIIADRYARSFVMPNFTPANWFECDVMEITHADLMVEFEIKLTRGDFFADALKCKDSTWRRRIEIHAEARGAIPDIPPAVFKHDLLAAGDVRGPARFWFVTPRGMIEAAEVPDWAGLMEAYHPEYRGSHLPPIVSVVKAAPQLHRVKADEGVKANAFVSCYWRMHKMFLRLPESTTP